MIAVLISSTGAAWTFYATVGDKVFLIETKRPSDDQRNEALAHMVRECRWMFGNLRIICLRGDKKGDSHWIEVLHDGTGRIVDFEIYDGPVPQQEKEFSDE